MSALATVKELQESLNKELPAESDASIERVQDILHRLEECNMTLEILTQTMIGKDIAKLKSHQQLGASAKNLVKKWKQVAKGEASETASSNGAAVKKEAKMERRESLGAVSDAESEWVGLPPMRQNICKKMYEFLVLAKPDLVKAGVNALAVDQLCGPRAAAIENALFQKFSDKKDYTDKARSLAFNLKKNRQLCQDVVLGNVEAEELVAMSPEQLASAETLKARAQEAKKLIDSKRLDWEQANEDKINEMCGIKGDLLKASLFTCGRCKSTKTTSTQKQTRSADEPMTVFVLCLNCGKRWKC